MTALNAPLFRTWSPISDLQRMSVQAFDDQVKETPHLYQSRAPAAMFFENVDGINILG